MAPAKPIAVGEDEEIDDAAGPAAAGPAAGLPAAPNVSESVYACLRCVTRVFAGQLYGFWRDVPSDHLPGMVFFFSFFFLIE